MCRDVGATVQRVAGGDWPTTPGSRFIDLGLHLIRTTLTDSSLPRVASLGNDSRRRRAKTDKNTSTRHSDVHVLTVETITK